MKAHKGVLSANTMPGGMNMQTSNRRARFGRWLLLIWALAVLALMLTAALRKESRPRYDGATFVYMQAGRSHG